MLGLLPLLLLLLLLLPLLLLLLLLLLLQAVVTAEELVHEAVDGVIASFATSLWPWGVGPGRSASPNPGVAAQLRH